MIASEIAAFLASSPIFLEVPRDQLAEIAPLFKSARFPAGTIILRQGGFSSAVYFLCSGRLAARVVRGAGRETVAFIQPPDVFGELSFLTGRPCVADVEVVLDADVVLLEKEAVPKLPKHRDAILRGLLQAVAERLQNTVIRGNQERELPVALLLSREHFEAPFGFASELGRSLALQTGRETLIVTLGARQTRDPAPLDKLVSVADVADGDNIRSDIAQKLTVWRGRFDNFVLSAAGPRAEAMASQIQEFANFRGELIGPGDSKPAADVDPARFVVQSDRQPTLPLLSGSYQLIQDAADAELAYRHARPIPARFRRTVDSIARYIAGLQVGLALGGGAAWGWAHIGVLSVLEQAGIPVDVISGCSMGSVIGAFRCAGWSIQDLKDLAEYWRTRTKRFIEWRIWRMCLLNENIVLRTFQQYFGSRAVNQTETPFWANAVDIQTGREYTISSGTLVNCMRASIALPGLLPPHNVDSCLLVDAGIMDPVPVNLVRHMGCHFSIGVNAMAELESQRINPRYPFNAIDVMTRCMFVMGHEIGQARAEQAADVVFTPSLGDITMLQFGRSPEIIECGVKAAIDHLPEIQEGYRRLKEGIPRRADTSVL